MLLCEKKVDGRDLFLQKSSIVDIRLCSKYVSAYDSLLQLHACVHMRKASPLTRIYHYRKTTSW